MNESMYKYMKIGTIYSMTYPSVAKGEGSIVESIKRLVTDDYFNAIEITWIKDKTVRKVENIKKAWRKNTITNWSSLRKNYVHI